MRQFLAASVSVCFAGCLALSASAQPTSPPAAQVQCEGSYRHHLQGVCADSSAIYWSFTTELVKTDRAGKVLKSIPVANHHGDLCIDDGKLYVAVNYGKFNRPAGEADNAILVYNADDLALIAEHPVPEAVHGAGGIGVRDGHFFVVGGLPEGVEENYVFEYDNSFKFLKKHIIPSGYTRLGIQTAAFADGQWWFGCYGSPAILLVTDGDFQLQGRYEFNASLGIEPLADGRFLVASGRCRPEVGCTGWVRPAVADANKGLRYDTQP